MTHSCRFARAWTVALCLGGCLQTDVVGRPAPVSADAGAAPGGCPARPALPDPGASGDPEVAWFGRALCTCEGLALGSPLSTVGAVGINGRLDTTGAWLSGPLVVGALQAGAEPVTVDGDLRAADAVATDGLLLITGDADIGGGLRAAELQIDGRLTQPAGAPRSVAGREAVAAVATGPVVVPPPCACAAPPDLGSTARAGAASAGNDPDALSGVRGPVTATLACGTYGFGTIAGSGTLILRVRGPTVVYVTGDLALGALRVELAPSATLDLFVGGGVVVDRALAWGDPDRPSAGRLFVGTRGTINLAGPATVHGQILAPTAELAASDRLRVDGGLFVRRLSGSATIDLTGPAGPD